MLPAPTAALALVQARPGNDFRVVFGVTLARMKEFQTSISIHATLEAIWEILTDGPNYTTWNTTVDEVKGRIAAGQRLIIHTKMNPGRAFPLKITEFVCPRKMVWTGGMPFGLFTGERVFTLTPGGDGLVEFSMREVYSGPLTHLFEKSIPNLQPAFDEFAAALKTRAERIL
jgi:hypothetical protein